MGVLFQFEQNIIGSKQQALKEGDRLTIRRQQCIRCKSVLALELHLNGEIGAAGDHYVVDSCFWVKGEPHLVYKSERWYGNRVKCPVCGIEGRLPMDKPLNYEAMQKRKVGHAVQNH